MNGVQQTYRPRTMRSLAIVKTGRESSSACSPVLTIERLQMAQDIFHVPVLESEIVELFASLPTGVVVDATLGVGLPAWWLGYLALLARPASAIDPKLEWYPVGKLVLWAALLSAL